MLRHCYLASVLDEEEVVACQASFEAAGASWPSLEAAEQYGR